MNTTATVPDPTQHPPTVMSYNTPDQSNPCTVCFSNRKEGGKHILKYAMVTGSKRVRRELDMPCSAPVFDRTMEHIAKKRFLGHSIHAEIGVLQAEGDVLVEEIHETISTPDEAGVKFWEYNKMLFGTHDDTTSANHALMNPSNSYAHFIQAIENNDAMKEKHHFFRNTNVTGTFEHLFAIVYRFQLDTECVFVYASHIETTGKHVKMGRCDEIWSMLNEEVRQRPKPWFNAPSDITFENLKCEIDGWEA